MMLSLRIKSRLTVVLLLIIAVALSSGLSMTTNTPAGRMSVSNNSRRSWIKQVAVGVVGTTGIGNVFGVAAANAAAAPTPTELERLQRGHARIQYLLQNWDDITRVCGTQIMSDTERKQVIRTENGGGTDMCSKDPLRVQEFMGYKSTEDPLYKADKLMVRAGALVSSDDFENYLDVVERYREKADQTALLAYTSSWGEANPNGGKEVIDDYLEQTKVQVVESEKLLRSALGYLNLKTLPPTAAKS